MNKPIRFTCIDVTPLVIPDANISSVGNSVNEHLALLRKRYGIHCHPLIRAVSVARQHGLATLLDLDDQRFQMEDGTFAKFEVSECDVTPERPHGIRYNLTYHDKHNQHVIGFDNSHAPPTLKRKRFGGRKVVAHDHKYVAINDKGKVYEFESAEQLLKDFWEEVARWRRRQQEKQA